MLSHAAVANTIADLNARFAVSPADRLMMVSSMAFDLSVYDIFGAFAAGAAVIVPPPGIISDPASLTEMIIRHGLTLWSSVPVIMQLLLDYLDTRASGPIDSVRLVWLSGDWVPPQLPARIRRHFPNAAVVALGGATEAAIWSIVNVVRPEDEARVSIPYGVPLAAQSFHVLDECMRRRPSHVAGELYIGGSGLAMGYWRDPVQSAQRFVPHPETGERLYRTGDYGRVLADGRIEFLGRRDGQVKVGGHRVELREIELVLLTCPEAREAAVVCARDAGGEARLVAFVVPRQGGQVGDLREFLSARVPSYMVPGLIRLVPQLPLNINGKIDRKRLQELALDYREAARTEPQQADDGLSGSVLQILRQRLPFPIADLNTDLIASGATSIDMIRCLNVLQHQFGRRPSLRNLWRTPTAATIVQELRGATTSVVAAPEVSRILVDPESQKQFIRSNPGRRRFPTVQATRSLTSDATAGVPIDAFPRRSTRHFAERPFAFERLARLLTSLVRSGEANPYGSASGLFPVQVYLHVKPGRVLDIQAGSHYLDPIAAQLIAQHADADVGVDVHIPFVNQPTYQSAAFSIFLVCDLDAIEPIYAERSLSLAALEAGAMAHRLEMTVADSELGLCQIGTLDFDPIRHWFDLGPRHVLVHSLIGGSVV
jgi:SagB-type dehydrogenase family enzyme